MNARKLANKLGALKNQLIFSAHVQDTGVGRKKRGIKDTTVDGMKINRDDFAFLSDCAIRIVKSSPCKRIPGEFG
jgi:hypothetical protein